MPATREEMAAMSQRGAQTRRDRVAVRNRVKSPDRSGAGSRARLADELEYGVPHCLRTTHLATALEWTHHLSSATRDQIAAACNATLGTELGRLTYRQLVLLVNALRGES